MVMNPCPESSKLTPSTLPVGPGPASPWRVVFRILESSKIDT